ncbi:DUF1266 domain-containing protein [Rapidithrix thailandica]|uniref:DUF1266 domain-containing protein n=1 Tax=Rapidithrix thailandica TaxID=413964 RepID=A0AAW9S0I7_9BACT
MMHIPLRWLELTDSIRWCISLSSILTEANYGRHDLFWSTEKTQENIDFWKKNLISYWDVHNTKEALDTLYWLRESGGHRKNYMQMQQYISSLTDEEYQLQLGKWEAQNPDTAIQWKIVRQYAQVLRYKGIMAWDLGRYISLCRWFALVGYLDEEEAYNRMKPMAHQAKKYFNNWNDWAVNYMIGRQFWSKNLTLSNTDEYMAAYTRLKNNPESPFNTLDWNVPLEDD